jgi:hypothetical protein
MPHEQILLKLLVACAIFVSLPPAHAPAQAPAHARVASPPEPEFRRPAPLWNAVRHNGSVEPITLQWTGRRPALHRLGLPPTRFPLNDLELLRPPRISRPGPQKLAPRLLLANGDGLPGWPVLPASASSPVDDATWTIDSSCLTTSAHSPRRLELPRSAVHRLEFADAAALFCWAGAPTPPPPPASPQALVQVSQPSPGEVRVSSLGPAPPTRIEFQVAANVSGAEWVLWSGTRPLAALAFAGTPGLDVVELSGTTFRRPERPGPPSLTEPVYVVWESGAFGWRLWLHDRLVAEQTAPLPGALSFEWRHPPAGVAPWRQVRVWQPRELPLRRNVLPQNDIDSLERTTGDYLFGQVVALTTDRLQFETAGQRADIPWSDVASIQFLRRQPPLNLCRGWIGDLTLTAQSRPWRVAVVEITPESWTIQHPVLGEQRLPMDAVVAFAPRFFGEYRLLAAGGLHLGDETRPDFDHPLPLGLVWSTMVPRPAPGHRIVFEAHVRELAPVGIVGNSQILLDGQPVATLNAAPREGRTRTVSLELPAARFTLPQTRLDIRVDRPTTETGAADDWELVNPALLSIEAE